MAFTIKIYEDNEYIYSLLKKRLGSFYPDAYIVNPYVDGEDNSSRFSSFTRVICDPSNIDIKNLPHDAPSPIRLTEDSGIIDCARLVSLINPPTEVRAVLRPASGSVYAVLPFVYSNVRDRFISDLSSNLAGADFNIRLDFTSKLRALWRGTAGNNMTSLLEACRSKKFIPEDILKYCNMDESGFLTPGGTTDFDDVYDLGTERSITLLNHAANLTHSHLSFTNVVAVVEGFKTKELPELLSCCDKVSILLPDRSDTEDIGAQDLISLLTRTLGRERVSVYYADDILGPDESDDSLIQRSLVV